jgi:hypothetical protein
MLLLVVLGADEHADVATTEPNKASMPATTT